MLRRVLAFFGLALLKDLQQSRWEHACDAFTLALYENMIKNLNKPIGFSTSYHVDIGVNHDA